MVTNRAIAQGSHAILISPLVAWCIARSHDMSDQPLGASAIAADNQVREKEKDLEIESGLRCAIGGSGCRRQGRRGSPPAWWYLSPSSSTISNPVSAFNCNVMTSKQLVRPPNWRHQQLLLPRPKNCVSPLGHMGRSFGSITARYPQLPSPQVTLNSLFRSTTRGALLHGILTTPSSLTSSCAGFPAHTSTSPSAAR
ncbi:hypothetical protein EV426DRAFT_644757 [Tirmania nivea]|nr:hypothetical protein EV426DRAFT_644757 [Tirmania nivea]